MVVTTEDILKILTSRQYNTFCSIKATLIYRSSKVINRLRENKSGLQTKPEGNTSTIRGKQRNNRNTEVHKKKSKRQCNTHRNEL